MSYIIDFIKKFISLTTGKKETEVVEDQPVEEYQNKGPIMTNLQLAVIAPTLSNNYKELMELFSKYQITTVPRIAEFMAQCGHESMDFKRKEENLNYSANGLLATFKKYFTEETAKSYARLPEKIANRVYANRMGNGDEASGDGWKYRGRGFIQLTGKDNYTAFAKHCGKDLEETVKYLSTVEGALESALWYWATRALNTYADKEDHVMVCKKINGGTHGLEDRIKRYEYNKKVLQS